MLGRRTRGLAPARLLHAPVIRTAEPSNEQLQHRTQQLLPAAERPNAAWGLLGGWLVLTSTFACGARPGRRTRVGRVRTRSFLV